MNDRTPTSESFTAAYADEQLRRSRSAFRKWFKKFYINNMLRYLEGPSIDYGCGAGQLLAKLPAGSIGVEINPILIQQLRADGLTIVAATGKDEDFELQGLRSGFFRSLVCAHVLEHLDNPARALGTLFAACERLGIRRVLIVVPGAKGFASDPTHQTFIDHEWLTQQFRPEGHQFKLRNIRYFPGPRWLGALFSYHETLLIFDRIE